VSTEQGTFQLESWLTRGHGLFTAADQTLARQHIAALTDLPAVPGVPCHLDYQPANWLIDATGTLRILDFEHARIDATPRDLVRLTYRHWTRRPDLREAFLDGYGRALTGTEQQTIRLCAALDAVTAVVRGHQRGNAELTARGRSTFHQLAIA
jgi:thiamine kinase-like enzyme